MDIGIEEGARTIVDIREALSRLPSDAVGQPALFRFTTSDDDPPTFRSITPLAIPVDGVAQYERLAAGAIQTSNMRRPTAMPPGPVFDPATVRERFQRDNRAVQVMSLWQSERGGTPAVQAAINFLVARDQTPEPLITGMLNMSAVLLHMTAAAIGVPPEGLLGGMLDVYAAQSDQTGVDTAHPQNSED